MSDLVGAYTLVSETLLRSDLRDFSGMDSRIELYADGYFRATNVPGGEIDFPGPEFFESLRTGSGTWRVDVVGSIDSGWQRKTVWGVYLDSHVRMAQANITGQRSPYGLMFVLGDSDRGEALIFESGR